MDRDIEHEGGIIANTGGECGRINEGGKKANHHSLRIVSSNRE